MRFRITVSCLALLMIALIMSSSLRRKAPTEEYHDNHEQACVYLNLPEEEDIPEFEQLRVKYMNGEGYIFLPSYTSSQTIKIIHNTENKLVIDGKSVESGDAVDISGGKITLSADGNKYRVRIMHSKRVGTLYIDNQADETVISAYSSDGELFYYGMASITRRENEQKQSDVYSLVLDKKADLLGMGVSDNWVLARDTDDSTGLRTYLTSILANRIGSTYQTEMQPVDTYINGDYNGSYFLYETAQISESCVDIKNLSEENSIVNVSANAETMFSFAENAAPGSLKYTDIPYNPSDISGGYLLMLNSSEDYTSNDRGGFVTSSGSIFTVEEPFNLTKSEAKYIASQTDKAIENRSGIKGESIFLRYLLGAFTGEENLPLLIYRDSEQISNGEFDVLPYCRYITRDSLIKCNSEKWISDYISLHGMSDELKEYYKTILKPGLLEMEDSVADEMSNKLRHSMRMDMVMRADGTIGVSAANDIYDGALQELQLFIGQRTAYLDEYINN